MDCKHPQDTCNFQCWGWARIFNTVYKDILLMPQQKTAPAVRCVKDRSSWITEEWQEVPMKVLARTMSYKMQVKIIAVIVL